MKITIECNESNVITIPEIVEKLGLGKWCQKQCDGNDTFYEFANSHGTGTFDVICGEVEYDVEQKDNNFNYYERELGCYSLAEALGYSTLVFGEDEDGNTVGYFEG